MSKGALAENGVMGLPFPRVALARAFTGVIWRISSRVAAVLGLSHLEKRKTILRDANLAGQFAIFVEPRIAPRHACCAFKGAQKEDECLGIDFFDLLSLQISSLPLARLLKRSIAGLEFAKSRRLMRSGRE
jgi:hypothetical protein